MPRVSKPALTSARLKTSSTPRTPLGLSPWSFAVEQHLGAGGDRRCGHREVTLARDGACRQATPVAQDTTEMALELDDGACGLALGSQGEQRERQLGDQAERVDRHDRIACPPLERVAIIADRESFGEVSYKLDRTFRIGELEAAERTEWLGKIDDGGGVTVDARQRWMREVFDGASACGLTHRERAGVFQAVRFGMSGEQRPPSYGRGGPDSSQRHYNAESLGCEGRKRA